MKISYWSNQLLKKSCFSLLSGHTENFIYFKLITNFKPLNVSPLAITNPKYLLLSPQPAVICSACADKRKQQQIKTTFHSISTILYDLYCARAHR